MYNQTYFFNTFEDLVVKFSFLLFALFLLHVVVFKIASGVSSYQNINRLHLKYFFIYLSFSISLLLYGDLINLNGLLLFLIGSFIFYSLHYVYLFSLIGLAKKSISINILSSIHKVAEKETTVTIAKVTDEMKMNNIAIENIRENRLLQMTHLGFAIKKKDLFSITTHGKIVNTIGSIVLKIWNQKRL